jgi:protein-S-isoprenylcysteine O-methyltransferase Ste14
MKNPCVSSSGNYPACFFCTSLILAAIMRLSPIADGKRDATRLVRAVSRWAIVLAVLGLFALLHLKHPYYRSAQFIPWRSVFPVFIGIWAVLGIPYCWLTLKRFESLAFYASDSALHWLVIARVAWGKRSLHLWKHRRLKNAILSSVVKGFFSPLMAGFLSGHLTGIGNALAKKKQLGAFPIVSNVLSIAETKKYLWELALHIRAVLPNGADFASLFTRATYTLPNVRFGLDLAYDVVFMADCGVAFFGYIAESRFLGNKTRSVEPSAIGWACAIFCYPPFNNVLGTYAPFIGQAAGDKPHIVSETGLLIVKGFIVFFFTIYAAATVSFGAKFSNLTNRGTISRGPYAIVRHPAYTCKCIAWWLEQLPTLTVGTAFALVALCCVYALRAFTEEKHLSKDPEYLAYKKKVRWAAIPGIF